MLTNFLAKYQVSAEVISKGGEICVLILIFSDVTEIFGAMSHLVEFLADYNELVGSVPRSLKECKKLEKIYLNGNKGLRKPALAPQAQHFAGGIFYEDKQNTQAFLKSIGALFYEPFDPSM